MDLELEIARQDSMSTNEESLSWNTSEVTSITWKQYVATFYPKPDITIWELAKIMEALPITVRSMDESKLLERIPEDLRRHFQFTEEG
jgi:hypothetical protein